MSVMLLKKNPSYAIKKKPSKLGRLVATFGSVLVVLIPIIVALIGRLPTIPILSWQKDTPTPPSTNYVGRVSDIKTNKPVNGAEVTIVFTGISQTIYTDSEGIFAFTLGTTEKVQGKIFVRADGFDVYDRVVELSPGTTSLDIRLDPLTISDTPPSSINLPQDLPESTTSEGVQSLYVVLIAIIVILIILLGMLFVSKMK